MQVCLVAKGLVAVVRLQDQLVLGSNHGFVMHGCHSMSYDVSCVLSCAPFWFP